MVIKRLVFVFILCTIFMATAFSPVKAANGGFYNLSGGNTTAYGGGTAIIDWRDLEPEEGQYRWELLTAPYATFVSWMQYWNKNLLAEKISQFSQKEFTLDLRPFLALPERARIGELYEVAKETILKRLFS